MKKSIFLMLLALPLVFAFVELPTSANDCDCRTPTNVHKTFSTASSINFAWDAASGASSYKVKYLRVSDGYVSSEWTTSSLTYTFTGLSAGAYKFYFTASCGEAGVSDAIVIEDVIDN